MQDAVSYWVSTIYLVTHSEWLSQRDLTVTYSEWMSLCDLVVTHSEWVIVI